MDRSKPLLRRTEIKRRKGIKPGPWTRSGKKSPQSRKTEREDRQRSLWIRTLNASIGFSQNADDGYYPHGSEGLRWGKCSLEGCNRIATTADHRLGRSGATSPSKTDARYLLPLCTSHNDAKGSEHWEDLRTAKLRELVDKLFPLHFDEIHGKPGVYRMNYAGKTWLRGMYGSTV